MRGKPDGALAGASCERITPAHAGKTPQVQFWQGVSRGSPPRMRGKLPFDCVPAVVERITPAHAGKTLREIVSWIPAKDHPRACGENCKLSGYHLHCRKSPPRMRGKLLCIVRAFVFVRITPACAGKTPRFSDYPFSTRDHPRVCGENKTTMYSSYRYIGSPPRVRGKHRLCRRISD